MRRLFVLATLVVLLTPVVGLSQHIHFLLVSDTADGSIGEACSATIRNVQQSLAYLIPQDRYSLEIMASGSQTYDADSVLARIRNIVVERDDTFVFLYDGHGARAEGHHFLHMPDNGRLWSADVQNAVRRKPCDLGIILSSSCNVSEVRALHAPAAMELWNAERDGMAPVMEELFIKHSGLMHMNSAWPEQFGFTNKFTGSWLFDEFFGYCLSCPTGRPTWRCIDRMMDRQLGARFQNIFHGSYIEPRTGYTQTSLKTISWSFPQSSRSNQSRFGVVADETRAGTGVMVTRVVAHSPAHGILQIGDVIQSINGQNVDDASSLLDAVRSSPRTMHCEFRRNGSVQRTEVMLAW